MDSKHKNILLISLAAILLATAVVLGVLLTKSNQRNSEMQELFALEKEELESEY